MHGGPELDLLVVRGRRRLGFEFKHTDAPRVTRSMHSALRVLGLDSLDVLHVGRETYPLAERIRAVAGRHILGAIKPRNSSVPISSYRSVLIGTPYWLLPVTEKATAINAPTSTAAMMTDARVPSNSLTMTSFTSASGNEAVLTRP